MILSKGIESLTKDFDFTEGIVSEVRWESNLLDLLIVVYYYWDIQEGRSESRYLTIRFKNCREAIFNMPRVFSSIPKNELSSYVYSWYTITNCMAKSKDGLIEVSIKTVDDNPRWLTVRCDEIWIEGEEQQYMNNPQRAGLESDIDFRPALVDVVQRYTDAGSGSCGNIPT